MKKQKSVLVVTILLQVLILATLIYSIITLFTNDNKSISLEHIGLCIFTFILLYLPSLMEKTFKINIPSNLQIIAIVFLFTHFILGEVFRAYDYSLLFDKILHTTSGIVFACLGFSLVNLLNENKNTHLTLSPFFVAFFAFCFSMMIASIWEIYEFSYDSITGGNMQKWQIIGDITNIKDPGKLGLIDTMWDMIVCLIGSIIVSVGGYYSLKSKGNWLNKIMITKKVNENGIQ